MMRSMNVDDLFAQPALARQRDRLLELLRTLSFQEREVTLSSGAKSNFYIDCKQVSLDAEGAIWVASPISAEVLRVLDSMQLTAKHKVATPVNWKQGDDVIIVPAVSNEEAQQKYPEGWKTLKPYLRVVKQPK
jgi:hypothetical protein